MRLRGLVVMGVLYLWASMTHAATYHVALTGSDTLMTCGNADYSTTGRAKSTVSAGKNCATAPGDTVIIHPGTYTETVTTSFAGTPGNPITIKGAEPGVVIQGNLLVVHAWITIEDLSINLQSINVQGVAHDVQLLRVTVTNAPVHGIVIDSTTAIIDNIFIHGCTVSGSGNDGIRGSPDDVAKLRRKTNITIDGCLIHDIGEDGIGMSNVDGLIIRNSTIYNAAEEGIDIKENSNNTLIENNTVYNNHNAGIMINPTGSGTAPPIIGGTFFRIVGNTVYGSGTIAGDSQIFVNSMGDGGANRSLIANNLIIGSAVATTDGISLFRALKVDVVFNTIVDVTRWGILGRCYRDGIIENNIIDGFDRVFSAETSGANCTGYANGLITEDYNDLLTSGSELIRWTNATAYSNLTSYQSATGQGAHSLSVNPQFVGINHLRLLSTSPVINVGLCLTTVPTDLLGSPRPYSSGCDMGAYEFVNVLTLATISPAIDKGFCVSTETTDVLGQLRPSGLSCDMGSYELINALTLASTSPAINAAICLAAVPTDVFGWSRPSGIGCDVGAYELVALLSVSFPTIILLPGPSIGTFGQVMNGGTYTGGRMNQ